MTVSTVFHAVPHERDRDVSFLLSLRPTPARVEKLIEMGALRYVEVAEIPNCGDINRAFFLTNTIDNYWWENPGVTRKFSGEGTRSTSAGDVIFIANPAIEPSMQSWLCAGIGMERMSFDFNMHAHIFELMDNAKDNGYDFSALAADKEAPLRIAEDMIMSDPDLEDEEPEVLIPHVKAWIAYQNYHVGSIDLSTLKAFMEDQS